MTSMRTRRGPAGGDPLQQILDRIALLPSQLRQGVVDELWSKIPTYIDEYAYAAAQAANAPLLVQAQTTTLELIQSVVVCIPAGATGVVQLGSMVIPVGAGTTTLAPVSKQLATSDTRSVTASAAGPVFLWLTGVQQPTFGVLQP